MLDPEHEMLVDLSPSCTRQVAAAKLLGWMRGPTYRRYIHVNNLGVPIDQKPFLNSIEDSLADQLAALREVSRNEVIDSFEGDASSEMCDHKLDQLESWDEQIRLAAMYLRDIDDELAIGDTSELRIDRLNQGNSTDIHITLSSLDKWACKEYGISIFYPSTFQAVSSGVVGQVPPPQVEEFDPKGGLSKATADSLFTSFALLVEAFSKIAEKYRTDGKPNVTSIAKQIEKLATAANRGEALRGQGHDSIRKSIAEALKRKKSKLDGW